MEHTNLKQFIYSSRNTGKKVFLKYKKKVCLRVSIHLKLFQPIRKLSSKNIKQILVSHFTSSLTLRQCGSSVLYRRFVAAWMNKNKATSYFLYKLPKSIVNFEHAVYGRKVGRCLKCLILIFGSNIKCTNIKITFKLVNKHCVMSLKALDTIGNYTKNNGWHKNLLEKAMESC